MNHTIAQILHLFWLYEDQEHWPYYVAVTEIAINFTLNASIKKTPFEDLYSENISLPIDLLVSRESSINPHTHNIARKIKLLVTKVKSAMQDA